MKKGTLRRDYRDRHGHIHFRGHECEVPDELADEFLEKPEIPKEEKPLMQDKQVTTKRKVKKRKVKAK